MGLAASGCVNTGQIANLTESRRATIAFESIDGPPPAVFNKLVQSLKDEAGSRRITVVPPSEANYRLRGYLAAHPGDDGATSIAWVLDVYDSNQRRAFRLNGEERAAGRGGAPWAAADDQVLSRIARASMERFTAFLAAGGASTASASPPAPPTSSVLVGLGWPDDWTPEASGIFRIFKREPSRTAEVAADAAAALPPDEVPLPRGRPAPDDVAPGPAFAFAPEDR